MVRDTSDTQSPSLWCSKLFGRPRPLGLPQLAGDGESVHAHGHGFRRDDRELLAVWAVFVDRLDHGEVDDPWADASQTHQFLCFRVHGVNSPELATRIPEEDEEVVGGALLHFLRDRHEDFEYATGGKHHHHLRKMTVSSLTSMILFFWGSLTLPAKQQREMALWIMNLLDLKLGSLYSLGPEAQKKF